MSPWSACVGDGETTCSTIMSVFALTPRRTFLGMTDEIAFRYAAALLPPTTSPSRKGCRGRRARRGVDGDELTGTERGPDDLHLGLSNRGRGRNLFGSNSGSFIGRANTGSLIVVPPGTGFHGFSLPLLPDPSLTAVNRDEAGDDAWKAERKSRLTNIDPRHHCQRILIYQIF